MAKALTTTKQTTTTRATGARPKTLGKVNTTVQALGAKDGKYLRTLMSKQARGVALTAEQAADLKRLSDHRTARNAYVAAWRKRRNAAKALKVAAAAPGKAKAEAAVAAAPTPAAAPVGTLSATNVLLHSAMTITKRDMIGALRVQLITAERSGNRANAEALRIALQLAQLLAD